MSCVMPPDSSRRWTVVKPAWRRRSSISAGRRQVGHALGQVAVGGGVGEQAADAGHDLAEVHAVAPADAPRWAGWRRRAGRSGRPGGRRGRARRRTAPSSTRLRSAKPHVTPSSDAVGHGQPEDVGLDPRRAAAVGEQHPEREVDRDRPQPLAGQLDAQVAGARGQVGAPANRAAGPASARPAAASGRRAGTSSAGSRGRSGGRWRRTSGARPAPWPRPRGGGRRPTVRGGRSGLGTGGSLPGRREAVPDCADDRLHVPSRGRRDPPEGARVHGRRRPAGVGGDGPGAAQRRREGDRRAAQDRPRGLGDLAAAHAARVGRHGAGADGDGGGVGRGGQGPHRPLRPQRPGARRRQPAHARALGTPTSRRRSTSGRCATAPPGPASP